MSTYVAVRWFIDEEHNQSSKFLRCTFAWRKHARSRYKDDVCEIVFSEDLTLANRCGSDRESHRVVSSHALFRLNLRRKTYFTSLNCKQFAKNVFNEEIMVANRCGSTPHINVFFFHYSLHSSTFLDVSWRISLRKYLQWGSYSGEPLRLRASDQRVLFSLQSSKQHFLLDVSVCGTIFIEDDNRGEPLRLQAS